MLACLLLRVGHRGRFLVLCTFLLTGYVVIDPAQAVFVDIWLWLIALCASDCSVILYLGGLSRFHSPLSNLVLFNACSFAPSGKTTDLCAGTTHVNISPALQLIVVVLSVGYPELSDAAVWE